MWLRVYLCETCLVYSIALYYISQNHHVLRIHVAFTFMCGTWSVHWSSKVKGSARIIVSANWRGEGDGGWAAERMWREAHSQPVTEIGIRNLRRDRGSVSTKQIVTQEVTKVHPAHPFFLVVHSEMTDCLSLWFRSTALQESNFMHNFFGEAHKESGAWCCCECTFSTTGTSQCADG